MPTPPCLICAVREHGLPTYHQPWPLTLTLRLTLTWTMTRRLTLILPAWYKEAAPEQVIIYREQRALHLQRVQRVAKALYEAAHGGGRLALHPLRTLPHYCPSPLPPPH